MGKQGPCRHCGVTSTPLWRNGPPEKPVLCNACGSRWRTRGSLTNYTPMHRRDDIDEAPRVSKLRPPTSKPKAQKAKKMPNQTIMKSTPMHRLDDIDDEEPRVSKLRPPTSNPKAQKAKKMPNNTIMESGTFSGQDCRWVMDADPSNRSSSGSAVSYSESCAQYGAADAGEMTGSDQSHAWESLVPSRKRSCINRPKASPVEKLAKDLNTIMHEEQLYYLSGSSEEDLLYHSETPLGSVEIGSGSVLLRNPHSKSLEEESEASSIPAENKSNITSESYSGSASFVVHSGSKESSNLNAAIERPQRSRLQIEDSVRRDTVDYENLHILESVDSPLVSVDLEDVINYTNFVKYLSKEDQEQLLKLLPPIDSSTPPESLRSMFSSIQFADAIHSYQRLLGEGILDPSFSIDEEWHAVKRLALNDLTKCNWLECYIKQKEKVIDKTGQEENINGSKGTAKSAMKPLKRPSDTHFECCAELNVTTRSSKRVRKLGPLASQCRSLSLSKSGYATKDLACTGGALNLFMLPPEELSSLIPLQYTENYSDQDLLLDIPANARHPEAELLYQPSQLSSCNPQLHHHGQGC